MRRRVTAAAVSAALAAVSAQSSPEFVPFGGGLDLVTPAQYLDPGYCREALNYECDVNGGYQRVKGYERFDGRPSPSAGNYAVITCTISGSFASGDTVTGQTSAATGVCIASTATTVVLTKVSGTFVSGENLRVGGVTQAVSSSGAVTDGASTRLLHAQYKNLAADNYRADIAAVPGSGNVLGVVRFSGVTYAFRNNAGGTAAAIYKSSSGGWTAVPLGEEISFTAAGTNVDEGDTLTQGGVTSTIKRIVLTSGTFAGGTAAGRLIIHSRAGGNYAAGPATTTGAGALTLSGAQTAITIQPGGRYEFVIGNFTASLSTRRIYGADGANRGFEFDGTDYSYTPITTGMTSDIPLHVGIFQNHLFFSFVGSVQHSSLGLPYVWSVVTGASEMGMGDTITGFLVLPGSETVGAMLIGTRNRISILYGTSVSNWSLRQYKEDQALGAYAYSLQDIGISMFLDDQGITDLQSAQKFGNFSHNAHSQRIRTWVNTQRTKVTASCVSRDKSQYRLFFSDQYGLFVTFNGRKIMGMMPVYYGHAVRVVWSSEESDGTERSFFGSTNGMVYEMEKGTSFDGDAIEHYLHLAFNFSKMGRISKHYRRAAFEVKSDGYAQFNFTYELGYGDSTAIAQPGVETRTVSNVGLVNWDSFTWDSFIWDGRTLTPDVVDMAGDAENVSIILRGNADFHEALRFSGMWLHKTPRRVLRGA